MESFGIADNCRTIRRLSRDLDGVFDRFGTRVNEHRLGGIAVRKDLDEFLAQLNIRLLSRDMNASVQKCGGLFLNGSNDPGLTVTDVHDSDATGKVDEFLSIDSCQNSAPGRRSDSRRNHRNATRRHSRAAGDQVFIDFHASQSR